MSVLLSYLQMTFKFNKGTCLQVSNQPVGNHRGAGPPTNAQQETPNPMLVPVSPAADVLCAQRGSQRGSPHVQRFATRIESVLVRYPRLIVGVHCFMVVFYLALIVIPPWLPAPADDASPLSNFVSFSQFVIWCIWWPFVLLSMLGFGRAWCGLLCPEGALSAFASRFGGSRPIPRWMRWGGIPLVAFVGITVLGQVLEVDERPLPQLLILGGSTLAAIVVGLICARRVWAWCRYLCPVSLLFGVFSRLGALHFRVDHARLAAYDSACTALSKKDPCPVQIHLPVMSTNRYCLMCFRCSGWRDSIHLGVRYPGEELMRINTAEPLFWEVMFLFGGAIGLPLGVFYGELADWKGLRLVALLLVCPIAFAGGLSLLTWLSARVAHVTHSRVGAVRDRFTCIGYLYLPLSLFSLFLGLSKPTFGYLQSMGFPHVAIDWIRISLLTGGVVWSLLIGRHILRLQTKNRNRFLLAFLLHTVGVLVVLLAWVPVFR